MSTLGRPWGIPTRESGLAKGPKMAKNSDFGLRMEKIRKTSKIWSYKSTTQFFCQENSIPRRRYPYEKFFGRLGLSIALHMQKHGPN